MGRSRTKHAGHHNYGNESHYCIDDVPFSGCAMRVVVVIASYTDGQFARIASSLAMKAPLMTAFWMNEIPRVSSVSEAATPNMSVVANTHFCCVHTSDDGILDTVLERRSQSEGQVANEGGQEQQDL